jgi:signal transduction histidine kinase
MPRTESTLCLLVVDDRRENLIAMEELLRDPRWTLLCARSGSEALRQLLEIECGLVVLDVQMPDMDGFEVATLMRSSRRTREIPILFATAIDREERFAIRGFELGAVDYVYKPIDPKIFRAKVVALMDLSIARRASEERAQALRERQSELLRSNRDLREFAHAVAHDLDAPLRHIDQYLGLLRDSLGEAGATATSCWLERASGASRRLSRMVHDALEYAKLDAAADAATDVDVRQVVSEAHANLAAAFEASGARLLLGELPGVRGVYSQLVRLFQNLFDNALKYRSAEPPVIRVEGMRFDGRVHFSVEDNGRGVPPDAQGRIFQLFHRGTNVQASEGSGVGLASCKRIVEASGGSIRLRPEARQGARFGFDLPAAACRAGDTLRLAGAVTVTA